MEKYGVEDRRELLEKELKEIREKLSTKTASVEEFDHLLQRVKDIKEAIESI
jgi:uncharacterized protein YlxW (UPF0749 family)